MSATTIAPEVDGPVGLKQKLLLIRRGLKRLPKNGWNQHHQYRYVLASDAVGKAQKLLDRYGVLLKPSVDLSVPPLFNGSTVLVPLRYTFEDVESGERETHDWLGAGQDKGDKGVYKAYTGALKFFLINYFQVEVGDAPEPEASDADGASTSRPAPAPKQAGGTVSKDADRAAATRIPIDRAKAILEAAQGAKLANPDGSFSAVFKAKLADVGVSKIGQLDVDQAEAVEAFIREEALAAKRETERAEA